MKRSVVPVIALLAMISTDANARFFFFIPGGLIGAISDGITGAKGDICVRENARIGDVTTSSSGNTATIKSLSGTSTRCRNPDLPIRAEVVFDFSFSSKAGINLPDEYEARSITDLQRFNGRLLTAASKSKANKGVLINARKREKNSDPAGIASAAAKGQVNALVDAKTSDAEQLVINGATAWRFEVTGRLKGLFGQQITFLVTIIEGDNEILIVNAFAPTSIYEEDKAELKKLSEGIVGIRASAPATTIPPASEASADADRTVKPPSDKEADIPPAVEVSSSPADSQDTDAADEK